MDVVKLRLCFIFVIINCCFLSVDCQQQNGMEDADAYLTTVSPMSFYQKFGAGAKAKI
jgi:hypothetical protein